VGTGQAIGADRSNCAGRHTFLRAGSPANYRTLFGLCEHATAMAVLSLTTGSDNGKISDNVNLTSPLQSGDATPD
jgi:hypothetical protein